MNAFANIARWREHPDQFVREVFLVEPEIWQREVLEQFPHQQRIAMCASKGVGKTCLEAWLAWNFLLTRPHPKIAAVAVSADNLSDNLWTEMAMWRSRSPLLKEVFELTKTRIFAKDHPETWWMSARSYPKTADRNQQSQTLAGLHAEYIMFILDESGGMPDAVMASAEAALSTCIEGHIIQAGNPTHLEGPLYRACTTERRLWHVININGDPDNPKRASRVSVQWAREQIEKYGRDDPFVLVNVFGQFPPASFNTLLGPDHINAACARSYRQHDIDASPRILGVDVARQGDDASVMWPRQGLLALAPVIQRNIDGIQGGGLVARRWNDWGADAVFIDSTGGFGSSWIDNLRLLGKAPIGVGFSESASNGRYYNKRSEIYFECAQWIKEGGQLPPMSTDGMSQLTAAMTRTTYTFKGDKLILEPKDMVKERIGYSPDHADALCLTFAHPVSARKNSALGDFQSRRPAICDPGYEYDPFHEFNNRANRQRQSEYNPFQGM